MPTRALISGTDAVESRAGVSSTNSSPEVPRCRYFISIVTGASRLQVEPLIREWNDAALIPKGET